ncbi:hypothetical protein G6F35_018570 [Rhizopus arrhizus]|nr:hypothetical protein G6F35_018570 [Rhizopus arrhizus]
MRSFSLPLLHKRASPCGSAIRKNTISAPNTMCSMCAAVSTDSGMPSACGMFDSATGTSTMKAAPKKLPMIEPSPPMITMNSSWNERVRANASGSHEPRWM